MVKISRAVADLKAAGLPYLVYLRHPTTGGVFASWGSLGHITVAQSGALIGFLGPKVYEALRGEPFPEGVQTAENLFRHGLVDAVLDPHRLRQVASDALTVISSRPSPAAKVIPPEPVASPSHLLPAWDSIQISRRPGRPGLRSLLLYGTTTSVRLSGTGEGESNRSASVSLSTFGGQGAVVVGLDRWAQGHHAELGPDALRQARRGMALAEELDLPLIAIVDTQGAALSREAEEGGLGGQIARCLSKLSTLRVPTLSVLLGEGTGGGALALLPADRLIAARHAWLAPLPPEGASFIRFGDTDHAAEMADGQRIRSQDLLDDGIVDEIVEELPTADVEAPAFCRRVGDAIARQMNVLTRMDPADRIAERRRRFDAIGGTLLADLPFDAITEKQQNNYA
jgi:acetyl-CoA carboxylase carboxyl transferase subunit beta